MKLPSRYLGDKVFAILGDKMIVYVIIRGSGGGVQERDSGKTRGDKERKRCCIEAVRVLRTHSVA